MRMLTIERIRAFDRMPELADLAEQAKLASMEHEDCREAILYLAFKLRIPVPELSSYIWLKAYIAELSLSYDEVPDPEIVAQQFGINWDDFQVYLDEQAMLLGQKLEEIPDRNGDFGVCSEVLDRSGDLAFFSDEEEAYLADLQEEAGDLPYGSF